MPNNRSRTASQKHLFSGKSLIGSGDVCLILGDNIFYGDQLRAKVRRADSLPSGAMIFGYPVKDPERYGVVNFDEEGGVVDLEEKPAVPTSN